MNVNEVIANRALELLGRCKGEYDLVSPNDHVNLSQSTNDVYPTAIKIALIYSVRELVEAMAELVGALRQKETEFNSVIKVGRTELRDAVPMTLGQEFGAYATTLGEDIHRLEEVCGLIREVNLGGTAIGTGINADPRAETCGRELRGISGLDLVFPRPLGRLSQVQDGRKALQDLQRSAPIVLRPPSRLQRDQPAGRAGRLLNNAG
jgi:aspartate ammonia-lyase